ncbi:uncharacterized protein LOC34622411 [Cyclospora cayetanensis]|uniref:Uncharacterized protein LOC34622411 n=1 Tax=Cyclospora cayetanensis TaxID=88456 RepID=A0A6P6RVH5_9EIME|nr:uncharacterized protein LOC34622411 [Cyclospora cayetanensis]
MDAFYHRQREQKMKELKNRVEAQQSLAAWRRSESSNRSSNNGSSNVLSRFLRSSSLSEQHALPPLLRAASSCGRIFEAEHELKRQQEQLQQQQEQLQQQQSLLQQLQIRAGEWRRGALIAARSQMLQREQQQDALSRRCCAPFPLSAAPLQTPYRWQSSRLGLGASGRRRRRQSLPPRLTVWGNAGAASAVSVADAEVAPAEKDRGSSGEGGSWWLRGPVARELNGVAAEAAAKAAAQSAAAAAAAAEFSASVEFFQFLRRTASDGCLLTRGKGPRWAGQKQLSRVGVQELLDRALEVGAAAAVAAPPEEAALVARSVETLVGALQVRVAQGQQRAKLHVLIARSCHHHHSKSTPIISHIHQQMGPLQQQAERPLMLSSEFPEGGQT